MENIKGITFKKGFIENHSEIFVWLKENIIWDEKMKSRSTASFGKPYDYNQMVYEEKPIPNELMGIKDAVDKEVGYGSNNLLMNFYKTKDSSMGYHSDMTDILEEGTGIIIISFGDMRYLDFKSKNDKTDIKRFEINSGDFFYMNKEVQDFWLHSIPKMVDESGLGRISLTFRKIK